MNYEEYTKPLAGKNQYHVSFIDRADYPEHITRYIKDLVNKTRHFVNDYNDDDFAMLAEGIIYYTMTVSNIERMLTANGTKKIIHKQHQDIVNSEKAYIARSRR